MFYETSKNKVELTQFFVTIKKIFVKTNKNIMKNLVVILLIFMLFSATVFAKDSLQKEEILCEGNCDLFVDANNDGMCDYAQQILQDRDKMLTKTVNEVANIYQIDGKDYVNTLSHYSNYNIKLNDSFQFLYDNYGIEPYIAKNIAVSLKTLLLRVSDNKQTEKAYYLFPVVLALVVLYLISHLLSTKKIINLKNHRRIWNIFLLITFLIPGILGILMVMKINFGMVMPLPFDLLFWHVEIGIAMFVISIFHIYYHKNYFLKMLKVKI